MPARRDIHSICVIGSGPIVIGQACEFDYAGCQALKVLRRTATGRSSSTRTPRRSWPTPGFADRTYIEPLDVEGVADVLRPWSGPTRCSRPSAARPALNLAVQLHAAGILDELGVELLGAPVDVINRAV